MNRVTPRAISSKYMTDAVRFDSGVRSVRSVLNFNTYDRRNSDASCDIDTGFGNERAAKLAANGYSSACKGRREGFMADARRARLRDILFAARIRNASDVFRSLRSGCRAFTARRACDR